MEEKIRNSYTFEEEELGGVDVHAPNVQLSRRKQNILEAGPVIKTPNVMLQHCC
jgi:hypothetical protein